jgi:HEPN domain-containing protein
VNTALHEGQYFFSDIRREGIVLYELDNEPLPEPRLLTPAAELAVAKKYFDARFPSAHQFFEIYQFSLKNGWWTKAAFLLHQSIETLYSTVLLTITSYGPPSHNLNFLRTLAEGQVVRLSEAWPRDEHRYRAWFNTLNEAYVKSRYSEHYEISEEALFWLGERTKILGQIVKEICEQHLHKLHEAAEKP